MPKSVLGIKIKGHVRAFDNLRPENTLFERDNIICDGTANLFARLLFASSDPVAGVWGLAIGAGGQGSGGWSPTVQPDPQATQIALVSEIRRKQLAKTSYLDAESNVTAALTTTVRFSTVLNSTLDQISVPIREMGLIGGGTNTVSLGGPTNMLTAPYFDPAAPSANTVTLINVINTPSFILPTGISVGIDWDLAMSEDSNDSEGS